MSFAHQVERDRAFWLAVVYGTPEVRGPSGCRWYYRVVASGGFVHPAVHDDYGNLQFVPMPAPSCRLFQLPKIRMTCETL